jgi:hypothetical protein
VKIIDAPFIEYMNNSTQLNDRDYNLALLGNSTLYIHYNADLTAETSRAMKGYFYASKRIQKKMDMEHNSVVVDCKKRRTFCEQ